MPIHHPTPVPAASERADAAGEVRARAAAIARKRPHRPTRSNREEGAYGASYVASFTKGFAHDDYGLLVDRSDYEDFVDSINDRAPDSLNDLRSRVTLPEDFVYGTEKGAVKWRQWESARAGHTFDLQGPDADSVGMAPHPRLGSDELIAEMAEVYAMALLRDESFADISAGKGKVVPVLEVLREIPWFKPMAAGGGALSLQEQRRRTGRFHDHGTQAYGPVDAPTPPATALTTQALFRGSVPGAKVGPYISQFMLIGNKSRNEDKKDCTAGGKNSRFAPEDGLILFGAQVIDQRLIAHKCGIDYMTEWQAWLDVQNGGDYKGADVYDECLRFITTPRDLATYVHFDALYQAYLNAALLMWSFRDEFPLQSGFPEGMKHPTRDAFATYGGPHLLSLLTEVATRCLKAVRRQKFCFHRRARPERIGGILTLAKDPAASGRLDPAAKAALTRMITQLAGLLTMVDTHNTGREIPPGLKRGPGTGSPFKPGEKANYLLPMAFPEGSPMHPAYGAGHATVAGGCVTVLKAFFDTLQDNSSDPRPWPFHTTIPDGKGGTIMEFQMYEGAGLQLKQNKCKENVTIEGELNKLAANIAIGRNMAGVHYYSDYYDSVRLGERVAVGILEEQMLTYGEKVTMRFRSFDADLVEISTNGDGKDPDVRINGGATPYTDWWTRHY